MTAPDVLRYAAFTDTAAGGNPAGVVLDAASLSDGEMLAVAAEVGYSECIFLVPRPAGDGGVREYDVRYFSPVAEVMFCGHATIAGGAAVADHAGPGDLVFHTPVGPVPVSTTCGDGRTTATFTTVAPSSDPVDDLSLDVALDALRWVRADLDPVLPPCFAFAGARHLVLAAAEHDRLARLDYDFDALLTFCERHGLTTVALVWREAPERFHARNPFPVGGVVEDPATGAAAAALGGYLREMGVVGDVASITVLQGEEMGRPSTITVDLLPGRPGVNVTGSAVPIPQ